MNSKAIFKTTPQWQDLLGRGLMWLAAVGAFSAFISGFAAVKTATSETAWVETWRLFGFLVFTGMFILVALRPRNAAGVWELAFLHKTAMAVSALVLSSAKGAAMAGAMDAILAILLVIAYVCTRGWQAWRSTH